MPYQIAFGVGQYYHIYNRGIRKSDIFLSDKNHERWLSLLHWCKTYDHSYSKYLNRLEQIGDDKKKKDKYIYELDLTKRFKKPPVDILAHVEMRNHFHLILKQTDKDGVSRFMHKIETSYSKYFNLLNSFNGPLYQGLFGAVNIVSDPQLLQVFRYVHINPLAARLASRSSLISYKWSSLPAYMEKDTESFLSKDFYLGMFGNSKKKLREFTVAEVDDIEKGSIQGLTHDDDFSWYVQEKIEKEERKRYMVEKALEED
jgi:REP element-mobilizing transposase RayT